MSIAEIIENRWFWTFWGTTGAYLMIAMKSRKIALPFFGDVATAYFGITFFFIGFCVQFSLLDIFFSSLKGGGATVVGILYHIFILLMFILTVKAIMKEKWFRPFAFIIMCFFAGMMARSLYEFVWGG